MKNLAYGVKKVIALLVGTAGANNGTGVDRAGYDELELLVSTGAATGTPTSFSVDAKIQDSADNSSFADVSGLAITAITADNTTGSVAKIDASGLRRYVRVVTTPAYVGGTSPKVPVATVLLLTQKADGPVA